MTKKTDYNQYILQALNSLRTESDVLVLYWENRLGVQNGTVASDGVKIKETENTTYLNKLAIVVRIGTWSADVRLIDSNRGWVARIAKDKLEVLACK